MSTGTVSNKYSLKGHILKEYIAYISEVRGQRSEARNSNSFPS